mmetsp:Transcript_746/g.811  ORF Transcript_746/g.811 Transcript_746/m.811 type:complete len:120 (-) Transcript_746:228-587(-)
MNTSNSHFFQDEKGMVVQQDRNLNISDISGFQSVTLRHSSPHNVEQSKPKQSPQKSLKDKWTPSFMKIFNILNPNNENPGIKKRVFTFNEHRKQVSMQGEQILVDDSKGSKNFHFSLTK